NSLSRWVKDPTKPDLSESQKKDLLERLSSDTSCSRVHWLSNGFLEEFYSLVQSQGLHAPFAGFRIKANKEGNCPHALLHYAIQAQKRYTAQYLLCIGANSNSVNKAGNSVIMQAL